MNAFIATNLRRLVHFRPEPVDNSGAIFIDEMVVRLVIRRHFRIAQHFINLDPSIDVCTRQEIRIEFIDTKPSFGFFRAMTIKAGFFKDRRDEFFKIREVRFRHWIIDGLKAYVIRRDKESEAR